MRGLLLAAIGRRRHAAICGRIALMRCLFAVTSCLLVAMRRLLLVSMCRPRFAAMHDASTRQTWQALRIPICNAKQTPAST
eukprot:2025060-Pleurochrysis_carterae.AAC.1